MPEELGEQQTATAPEADPNEGKTLLDAVKAAVGEGGPERSEGEGDAQKLSTTEEAETAEGGEPKEKVDEKGEAATEEAPTEAEPEKGPIPYERFEEVNTKYQQANEELERVKPLAEHHQKIVEYCTANNITQEQFSNLLEIQRLLNTEPEKALAKILPIVEAVQGFVGDRLPPDLQTKVDTGKIELEDARELAKSRAKIQFGATRYEQYQRIQQQREQATFQQQLVNSATAWVDAKRKANPDFAPKAKADLPDGLYEQTYDRFEAQLYRRNANGEPANPIRTAADIAALMERSYGDTLKAREALVKKPTIKQGLSHTRSGQVNNAKSYEEAKTLREAINM